MKRKKSIPIHKLATKYDHLLNREGKRRSKDIAKGKVKDNINANNQTGSMAGKKSERRFPI